MSLLTPSNSGASAAKLGDLIAERREAIRADHAATRRGGATVRALSELMDEVIIALYGRVTVTGEGVERPGSGCAVVAVGGYGRGELSPASDVDLMFLHEVDARGEALAISNGILHPLWDLGYTIGHSIRRHRDCLDLSRRDATIRTALMEARWLAGDRPLFNEFRRAFSAQLKKDSKSYMAQKLAERQAGYARFGATVHLLEPDIKKSKGGLRDIHYVCWLGLVRYGVASLQDLRDHGALSPEEYLTLTEAQEFLWLVRNEMHFHAGKSGDVLTFDEQVRLAQFLRYEDGPQLLGVERFMQQYHRLSMALHQTSDRFIRRLQQPSPWQRFKARILSRDVDGVTITPDGISIPERSRSLFAQEPQASLRLFRIAQSHGGSITDAALDLVRELSNGADSERWLTPEVQRKFWELFQSSAVGRTLEMMHQVGLLEHMLPEFSTARGLMQFNQYHKYTVDVHSIRAVQAVCALADGEGRLSSVYREIHRKDIVHLALLLHDIGKGKGGDHSVLGEQIAQRVAERLSFDPHERHLLTFLVRHHLVMSHIAFRRDLSDDKVLIQFARQVGHPELLKMFFAFTYADIEAVGPGTWTIWKEDLLYDLYAKAMEALAGTRTTGADAERLAIAISTVRTKARDRFPSLWLTRQFDAMPPRYLLVTPPDQVIAHLELVYRLPPDGVLIESRWEPDQRTTELTVATFDTIVPGLFSKLSGGLAALGFQILSAQVFTRRDGVVIDTFYIQDPDYIGQPPPERVLELKRVLASVVTGHQRVEDLFARKRRLPRRPSPRGLEPTQVEIDNETSDDFTIIDVFAPDAQGLLYVITRTLARLGLSVFSSKIATRLDQIVDVFYVQDVVGGKVTEPDRLRAIGSTLATSVDEYVARVFSQDAESPVAWLSSLP